MDTAPLTLFARKVSASNRLLFADLRRLRRDILPDGITTREEAEVLLAVDQTLERADEAWPDYLIATVMDFALDEPETGSPVRYGLRTGLCCCCLKVDTRPTLEDGARSLPLR